MSNLLSQSSPNLSCMGGDGVSKHIQAMFKCTLIRWKILKNPIHRFLHEQVNEQKYIRKLEKLLQLRNKYLICSLARSQTQFLFSHGMELIQHLDLAKTVNINLGVTFERALFSFSNLAYTFIFMRRNTRVIVIALAVLRPYWPFFGWEFGKKIIIRQHYNHEDFDKMENVISDYFIRYIR